MQLQESRCHLASLCSRYTIHAVPFSMVRAFEILVDRITIGVPFHQKAAYLEGSFLAIRAAASLVMHAS